MTSHQRTVAMPTVQKSALILLVILACTFSLTSSACERVMVRQIIRDVKQGCRSLKRISFACQGTCSSYVRVSPRDFGVVERSCTCCQEVGYRAVKVRFACPRRFPPYHDAEVRLPLDCACRPCNAISEADVREEVRLQDYYPD